MKYKPFLNEKLNEISYILQKQYKDASDVGVLTGISGIALFHFYYSKYLDLDTYADIGAEMISYCIEKINYGYSFPTFCTGIAGLGWAIQHLKTKDFIDVDCDSLLSPFDAYLYNQMIFDLGRGNYDFLHGALGYGFYFLSRYEHTETVDFKKRYQSYLYELIAKLETLSISEGSTLKWKSTLDIKKGTKGFNISLSHGMSSILNFLSRLYKFDEFKKDTGKLIRGNINYILDLENNSPKNLSLFPSWVEEGVPPEYNSRIAWCYGDLGIGLSLLKAGRSLDNISIQKHALEVLKHTTNRKADDQTLVNDAGICHGSYGNALIYQRLSQENNNELFKKMFNYWIEDGIEKAVHKNGYAGYKQWHSLDKVWTPELSLLEGISGIGLVIIDSLSKEPNSWDECLMIS